MKNQPICDIQTRDVAVLMWPSDYPRRAGKRLEEAGLLVWDRSRQEYERTTAGETRVDEILTTHGMAARLGADGRRYYVGGVSLSCGDVVEILLPKGIWLPLRFEIAFTDGRHQPVFYLSTASGPPLFCRFEGALESGIFRLLERGDDQDKEDEPEELSVASGC